MESSERRDEQQQEEVVEPVSPAGRLFLRPEIDQVINCVFGLEFSIDVDALKAELKKSIMVEHPRFRSVLIRDERGREYWRRLPQVDLDKHFLLRDLDIDDHRVKGEEEIVNEYLADLAVSSPLSTDKPLWEIHVLRGLNCVVVRIHHSLGDGISLMSLLLTCCRKVERPDQIATIPTNISRSGGGGGGGAPTSGRIGIWRKAKRLVMVVLLTLVFVLKFIGRALGVKDAKTSISGGDGVELWPRKVATAKFRLDDMKSVKKAVPNATINDVLFGVISSGLSRYLDLKSPNELKEGHQITGLAMVNIRKQPGLQDLSKLMQTTKSFSRWGNQFGFIILPVYYQKLADNPLGYVHKAKAMIDQKKLSLEAHLTYIIGYLVMKFLGSKAAAYLNNKVICNTSFTISNIVGPQEKIMFAGHPISYMRVTSTSLAHAITMHMVSYAGNAEMQILAAKDIIPEPGILAKCFQEALQEMKEAAAATQIQRGNCADAHQPHHKQI